MEFVLLNLLDVIFFIQITRIQNEPLFTQYQAQKSKVQRDLPLDGSIELERELWHGTSAESVKLICANEFNRSFAGKNGSLVAKNNCRIVLCFSLQIRVMQGSMKGDRN